MRDYSERFEANAEQAEYWNETGGPRWVQHQVSVDAHLGPLTDELIARAAPRSGERVLDIGCGSGATTALVSQAVGTQGHVVGIDISEAMLEAARARCQGITQVRFENTDAQIHSFKNCGYDLLISRFGVMFFSDPFAAFTNLSQGLRSGGRLHFMCWAALERNPWFTVPLEVAKRHLGPPEPKPPRAPGPLAFSEPEYVEEILCFAGFHGIDIHCSETTITSTETPEQMAALFLKLGAAARLVAERQPDSEKLQVITNELTSELQQCHTDNGVTLGATVYYVSAER